ncbi:MAG TPA: hypothetical protein ENF20_01530 [Candidatus Marinimicrobia bacterium]|nr:hypothetical protein [Candidatus Neomarinimicrobiota bacterium]
MFSIAMVFAVAPGLVVCGVLLGMIAIVLVMIRYDEAIKKRVLWILGRRKKVRVVFRRNGSELVELHNQERVKMSSAYIEKPEDIFPILAMCENFWWMHNFRCVTYNSNSYGTGNLCIKNWVDDGGIEQKFFKALLSNDPSVHGWHASFLPGGICEVIVPSDFEGTYRTKCPQYPEVCRWVEAVA